MSTYAVRSQLGTRLAQVYAPEVIAAFGNGATMVQVRVVVPGGAAAYGPAARADKKARTAAGQQLGRNKHIRAGPAATRDLVRGQVDSRLLITLAAVAARSPVRITSFSGARPGSTTSDPLHAMSITVPTTACQSLLDFLRAQRSPLRAAISSQRHGRTSAIQIDFTEPSLVGLLNAITLR